MPEPTPFPKPAVVIPDHELMRPIGRGSYGEVWLARSVLGEYRAVKVIRRDAFDRDRPVERELEGIQKFEPISRSQENLVHILHVGRFAEGFFYVMELADGARSQESGVRSPNDGIRTSESRVPASDFCLLNPDSYQPRTLRSDVLLRGRLPVSECLDIALKLTEALAHLHGHALVHRDVKPSNIIFVRGQPKLADIGLVATADSSLSCVGTEGFLPPEGPGKPQADLYAVGKVLYEISTGRDRHDFPELPTMLRDDPQRRALEELNEVVLKACDPDSRSRYATARAMHADLELLRAGKSLQQVRRRERRWAGGRKIAVGLAAIAIVLAVLLPRWTNPPVAERKLPIPLKVDGSAFSRTRLFPRQFDFSPDGERIVFADTNLISIWERKTSMTRRLELRGMTNWFIAGNQSSLAMPRWAPDNRHFVFQAVRKVSGTWAEPVLAYALMLVDSDTGDARLIGAELPAAEQAWDLCWRPDGQAVTFVHQRRRLTTLTLKGERTLWQYSDLPETGRIGLGDYSSDGAWLLVSAAGGAANERDERDVWAVPHLGGPGKRLTRSPGLDAYPTWGPDGETVYYVSGGGRRSSEMWGIWKLRVDRVTRQTKGPGVEVLARAGQKFFHPKFVAGGRTLAYAVEEPNTRVWLSESAAMDKASEIVRGQDPALSPDGQTVYFVGETPDQQGVFAIGRNGGKSSVRKITSLVPLATAFTRSGLSVSPDGQLLALFGSDGKRFGIFVTPTAGGEPRLIEQFASGDAAVPVWSPDGNWLAYAVDRELVRVSRDGRVREPLATVHRWHGWTIRWSPDGRHLAGLADKKPSETNEASGVYVVAVAEKTWKMVTPESEEPREKEGLEWHPSGDFLTYHFSGPETYSAQIRRAYWDGRLTDLMIDQPNHWDYIGTWSPDGRRFFFSSSENRGDRSIHLYDAQTKAITQDRREGLLARWSGDGRTTVWAVGETLRYFEIVEHFR